MLGRLGIYQSMCCIGIHKEVSCLVNKEQLMQMGSRSFEEVTIDALADVLQVQISSATPMEHLESTLRQLGNPYLFRVGNTPVRLRFIDEEATLEDKVKSYFIQRCQQILTDVFDLCGVLLHAANDEADVLAVQLQEPAPDHLRRLVVAGNAHGLFCGADRIHDQLQNFLNDLLVIRQVQQQNVIADILHDKLSVLHSSLRIVSFRFPLLTVSERREGKRLSIVKISIVILSITTF